MGKMRVVVLAVALACVSAELRLTDLTGSQGGAAFPIIARPDPCVDNTLLQWFSGMGLPVACPGRTTNSQTTFYGPGLGSTGALTGAGNNINLRFGGVGIQALFAGKAISATLAPLGRDCTAVAGNAESLARVVTLVAAGEAFTAVVVVDGSAAAWNGQSTDDGVWSDMELEDQPRDICFNLGSGAPIAPITNELGLAVTPGWFYSGFRYRTLRYCAVDGDCAANYAAPTVTPQTVWLSTLQQKIYTSRTKCCGRVCMNPNTHSCCSAVTTRVIEKATEKCCDTARGYTAFVHAPCECYSNTLAAATTAPSCPTEESECCLPSKYSELFPRDCDQPAVGATGTTRLCGIIRGQCYNPRVHRCCSDGNRYDPGSQQCCKISGLQSFDFPCPCTADADCQQDNKAQFGGQTSTYLYSQDGVSRQRCCIRSTPAAPTQAGCNAYVNYPAAQNVRLANTQCTGTCIDVRYQICCNGVACRREFERCCNATCCNRFSGTCTTGRVVGSPRHYANSREFKIPQDVCTTVEKLDEVRSFWIFILPAALLLATLGSLGFALVFANKASNRLFSFIEKLIIGISVAVILLGSLLFFSPAYKYGIFIVIVAILAILTAAARVKWFNAFTTIALVVLLLYIINPFDGNNYLTFNYLRLPGSGEPDAKTHGLFHLLTRMFPRLPGEGGVNNLCVNWYQGYFAFDQRRYSEIETNLANPTFAYCSRGFLTGLLIVSSINLVLLVALFILSVFGLVLRFRKQYNVEAPVELAPFPLY